MSVRELARSMEMELLEYLDGDNKTRPPEIVEKEARLYEGLAPWASAHNDRDKRWGVLPLNTEKRDYQKLDQPYTPVMGIVRAMAKVKGSEKPSVGVGRAAIFLPERAYLSAQKSIYYKTVGSRAVAQAIIEGFQTTPAFEEDESTMITDYVVSRLDSPKDLTVGLTSAHIPGLADIGELVGGLCVAVGEEHGLKYADRFDVMVNKNKTLQTYKVGPVRVPVMSIMTTGLGVYTGVPPGSSAEKYGISKEDIEEANTRMAREFAVNKRQIHKVMAFVPTGSEAVKTYTTIPGSKNETLDKVTLKDPSYTMSLTKLCYGGIIAANRFENRVLIGNVINTDKPANIGKREWGKILTDKVMGEHARQTHELTRVPVEYTLVYPDLHSEYVPQDSLAPLSQVAEV